LGGKKDVVFRRIEFIKETRKIPEGKGKAGGE